MNNILSAKNVKKEYRSGSRILKVINGLNLEVKKGESVAVTGASGIGKSTLLHLLGALDKLDGGSISLDGKVYSEMNDAALSKLRNLRIGYIYQFHHLLPEFSALENVMLPGMATGSCGNNSGNLFSYIWNIIHPTIQSPIYRELKERSISILKLVGLEERMNHRPTKLSGGEQQRVALARALVNNPDLVLADEPTGNLDLDTGTKMLDVILENTKGSGKALILVTHNPDIASRLDVTYELKDGKLKRV
jgi:lipoprotein-releasing system ATP-binding protein